MARRTNSTSLDGDGLRKALGSCDEAFLQDAESRGWETQDFVLGYDELPRLGQGSIFGWATEGRKPAEKRFHADGHRYPQMNADLLRRGGLRNRSGSIGIDRMRGGTEQTGSVI